jgi:hypothetical protein
MADEDVALFAHDAAMIGLFDHDTAVGSGSLLPQRAQLFNIAYALRQSTVLLRILRPAIELRLRVLLLLLWRLIGSPSLLRLRILLLLRLVGSRPLLRLNAALLWRLLWLYAALLWRLLRLNTALLRSRSLLWLHTALLRLLLRSFLMLRLDAALLLLSRSLLGLYAALLRLLRSRSLLWLYAALLRLLPWRFFVLRLCPLLRGLLRRLLVLRLGALLWRLFWRLLMLRLRIMLWRLLASRLPLLRLFLLLLRVFPLRQHDRAVARIARFRGYAPVRQRRRRQQRRRQEAVTAFAGEFHDPDGWTRHAFLPLATVSAGRSGVLYRHIAAGLWSSQLRCMRET